MIRISNLLLLSCLMTVASGDWETAHAQSQLLRGKNHSADRRLHRRRRLRRLYAHHRPAYGQTYSRQPGDDRRKYARRRQHDLRQLHFKAAKPDGLTIGHFIGGLFLQQLLGKPGIEFDAAKFQYVGVPGQDNFVIGVAKSTGITDVESWLASKQIVKFGGVASGSGSDDIPNVLKATLGLPIQLVSGYKGTADVRLAFNSGEVAGLSNSWESTKSTWRKELETGELKLVLQATLKPHPEFPKLPMALNYAKTDEAKRLISTVARVHGADGAALRPAAEHAQRPRADHSQSVHGHDERPRVSRRGEKGQSRYQSRRWSRPGTKRQRDFETRTGTDRQAQRNLQITVSKRLLS